MSRWIRAMLATAAVAALAMATVRSASAHEGHEIADGRFSLVVGFINEPAYTGFLNGLDLRVRDNSLVTPSAEGGVPAGAPVEGLELTLQAEIIYGDQRMPLMIEPRFQAPGEYNAWVVPMAAGDYSFHIWGTIGDVQIDEIFTSSPEGFSPVADQTAIQFPQATSSGDAVTIGAVSGDSRFGVDGAAVAGTIAGLAAGAAGLLLWQCSRKAPRLALARMSAGD